MIREINKASILLLLLLLSSCNSDVIFTDSVVMEDNIWQLSNVPDFRMQIDDTTLLTNVFFTIRTGSDYPFRNLFLFVTVSSPDGNRMTDTLEYYLADEKGNWYGKGFGDIHELNLPYRTDVFFPDRGIYLFKIQHGMRIGDLPGIYDFGLRIESSKR
jgi:gliding motility-associated lipoprotein GldH